MRERPTLLVETLSLTKHYRRVKALDDCTFGVERGEVFGLLGPNGAGKTTLLRLLLGYLRPTAGKALIGGEDAYRHSLHVRKTLSYLPGEVRFDRQLRGRDVLRFFAEVRPDGDFSRAKQLAERLELDLSRRVAYMSTGMRQKLALAVTFSPAAPLLILDEPTSNLDPNVRATVGQLVQEARDKGRTVLFSSHVLGEVEEVCDRVAILRAGKLVHTQVMLELRKRHRIRAALEGPMPAPPSTLQGHFSIVRQEDGTVTLDTHDDLSSLLGWLATLPLSEIRIEPVGLRAVYQRFHGGPAPISTTEAAS
jgi:ABC-2 type transport system ATP-binding protein